MSDLPFSQQLKLGAASSAGSAVANIAGSAVGGLVQQAFARRNMRYQQQLTKDYQTWLDLTSPGRQVAGMKAAGLNPATNGEMSVGSAPQPNASPSLPQFDMTSYADAVSKLSQAKLAEKQAATEEQNQRLAKLTADLREATFVDDVALASQNVRFFELSGHEKAQSVDESKQRIANLQQQLLNDIEQNEILRLNQQELLVGIENAKQQGRMLKVSADNAQRVVDAQINQMKASAYASYQAGNLDRRQYYELEQTFTSRVFREGLEQAQIGNEISLKQEQILSLQIANDLQRKYGDVQNITSIVCQGLGAGIGAAFGLKSLTKAAPAVIRGFR